MYRNFHLAANGMIVRGSKILLHHRTDCDMWDLPGGGLEKGEDIFQCLKREVFEETGLIIKPIILTGVYQNFNKQIVVFNFLVKVLSGKLTKNKEADDFYHFDYKKLPANMPDKQRERILDYFKNKKTVTVKIQKGISSV
jgi:8-oxo-dGTP pyrophosphatase MutT (NUDIX family)